MAAYQATNPLLSAKFKNPVSVETALSKVWEYHSFIRELGNDSIKKTEILATGKPDDSLHQAQIYLPGVAETEETKSLISALTISRATCGESGESYLR